MSEGRPDRDVAGTLSMHPFIQVCVRNCSQNWDAVGTRQKYKNTHINMFVWSPYNFSEFLMLENLRLDKTY